MADPCTCSANAKIRDNNFMNGSVTRPRPRGSTRVDSENCEKCLPVLPPVLLPEAVTAAAVQGDQQGLYLCIRPLDLGSIQRFERIIQDVYEKVTEVFKREDGWFRHMGFYFSKVQGLLEFGPHGTDLNILDAEETQLLGFKFIKVGEWNGNLEQLLQLKYDFLAGNNVPRYCKHTYGVITRNCLTFLLRLSVVLEERGVQVRMPRMYELYPLSMAELRKVIPDFLRAIENVETFLQTLGFK